MLWVSAFFVDTYQDQRRVEGDGGESIGRHAASDISLTDGDDGDTGGKTPEDLPEKDWIEWHNAPPAM
jgi:hypothetical protein